jgi:hypothetical protein
MTTVSFNTTNVLNLDNIGKLYRIDVPLSEGAGSDEALVYSTSTITNGKAAPASAIYLKNDDTEKSYFSVDRSGNKSLSLVVSSAGGGMNLYVFSPPASENGNIGNIDKYSFSAAGELLSETPETLTNPIDIAYAEQQINRDLDGNSTVGGALATNGVLDKTGSLYKVNVAGQDMFIVGTAVSAKSKMIDVESTVLKTGSVGSPEDQKAWQPAEAFTSYSAVRADDNGWDIYAFQARSNTVTQFSFDDNNLLKAEFEDGQVLKSTQVAALEKALGRNLNADAWFGVNIAPTAIDAVGGLYKASIQDQDFYVVGANLKSSTKALGAVDLSASLINESGELAWKEPEGYAIQSVVKDNEANTVQVYVTPASFNASTYNVKRFDFSFNEDTGNYHVDTEHAEGVDVNPFDLAKAEKLSGRDLDKTYKFLSSPNQVKDEFGVTVLSNLDSVGGLYQVSSLGQSYLVTGKNLVSNAKKITDLSNALTMDGAAWMPEGMTANQLAGKINIILTAPTDIDPMFRAEVYIKETEGFSKYSFTRDSTDTPWSTNGDKEYINAEAMASLEASTKRDLNNDGFFGARIMELKNAPGGLYAATYANMGTTNTQAAADAQKIYVRSDTKLSLGSTVAKNAVDFSSALRSAEGFWAPPEGYQVTGAFKDAAANRYSVIVSNGPADFRKYTFDISGGQTQLSTAEEDASYSISAQDLAALEVSYKRDLNSDGITGVRLLETSDKVGGLLKVKGADGDYFVSKSGASIVNNLQNAFFDETSNAWAPTKDDGTSITKLTLVQTVDIDTQANKFLIYQKQVGAGNVYSKYTFDENRRFTGKSELTLVDVANEETSATRDINGDGVIGAKVISAIDKTGGLYKVSIENKFFMVAIDPTAAPGRQTGLTNVLMGEDSKPLEIDQAGVLLNGDLEGWKVSTAVRTVDGEGVSTTKVFALKNNDNGYSDVKRLTFNEAADSVDYPNYKMLSVSENLNARDLIAEETNNVYGRDLNADKAVGLKIEQSIDKKAGLYAAKVLGQDYYFFDTLNRKTGTNLGTSIDLSNAFYTAELTPWSPPDAGVDEEPTQIAGLVTKKDGEDVVGYDIFTYNKKSASSEISVQKHSWTWSEVDGLVSKGAATDADTAELVEVEKQTKRDLSGDGFVGFRFLGRTDINEKYEGVTKATVLGGSETFFVVGKNLKPGTPTNPWKLSDALLSQDGEGPWSIPDEPVEAGSSTMMSRMITAVRDTAGSNARFVYVKYTQPGDAGLSAASFVKKYEFDKVDGKYTGKEERLDAVTLAAEEMSFKRDLNNDAKLGVYGFTDVKLSSPSPTYESRGIFSGTGKSSGLIKTNINNIDYLVVKKLPNNNTLLNLDLALVNESGGAWMPPADFLLRGVYKNTGTNETEVYGMVGNEFTKFEFTIEEMSQSNPLETYAAGTLPKVLKIKTVSDPDTLIVTPVSTSVTGLDLAERENVVGKDLDNDNTVGFKVASTVASIATGTALGVATPSGDASGGDPKTIYVVGKSLATMGATSSRTANQNALRDFVIDSQGNQVQVYWKPNVGETIQSIVETADNIKVYAGADVDVTEMTEYTFTRSDGTGFAGWNFDSSAQISGAKQIVDLEMSNRRDLNGDNTIGLKFVMSEQDITGAIKGSLGTESFYFAGIASRGTINGTTPLGIDTAKQLKDIDGNVWPPAGTIITQGILDSVDRVSDGTSEVPVPETADFVVRSAGASLAFFNSEYIQVT